MQAALSILSQNLQHPFPRNNFTSYKDKLEALKAKHELNMSYLSEKENSPTIKVQLAPVAELLNELNLIIQQMNVAIEKNNVIITKRKEKQVECIDMIWEHMAFLTKAYINEYKINVADINKKLTKLKEDVDAIEQSIQNLRTNIANLSLQIVNVDATMNSINDMLINAGFQGFRVKKKRSEPNKYQIVRDDGSLAQGLSVRVRKTSLHFCISIIRYLEEISLMINSKTELLSLMIRYQVWIVRHCLLLVQ